MNGTTDGNPPIYTRMSATTGGNPPTNIRMNATTGGNRLKNTRKPKRRCGTPPGLHEHQGPHIPEGRQMPDSKAYEKNSFKAMVEQEEQEETYEKRTVVQDSGCAEFGIGDITVDSAADESRWLKAKEMPSRRSHPRRGSF